MKTIRFAGIVIIISVASQFLLSKWQTFRNHVPVIKDLPEGTLVSLAGLPTKGRNTARVIMIEFSDYECPFCARYANTVSKEVDKRFVATGDVLYAFANNPLSFHSRAVSLATAAICGGQQDRYWDIHDALYFKLPRTGTELTTVVGAILDPRKFEQCMNSSDGLAERRIELDIKTAMALNISGTPSFALGYADGPSGARVTKLIVGAQPIEVFATALNDLSSLRR